MSHNASGRMVLAPSCQGFQPFVGDYTKAALAEPEWHSRAESTSHPLRAITIDVLYRAFGNMRGV